MRAALALLACLSLSAMSAITHRLMLSHASCRFASIVSTS